MKRYIAFVLMVVLCLGFAPGAMAAGAYRVGDRMMDFAITTHDGREIGLYETLKEKEMVVINIWASWCGYCTAEFPYMQEAYLEYMDRIEIIALTCEPSDTKSFIKDYAEDLGLTFPMGQDTAGLASLLGAQYIPTTALVGKNGEILYIESAAMSSTDEFRNLFDAFLQRKPTVASSSREEVKKALNEENADLLFTGIGDEYAWPMVTAEKDGRNVVVSSNTGVGNSYAAVHTVVRSEPGDVLMVEFSTSTESVFDLMKIVVDNTVIKVFGGEHDWMTYAYPFESAGEHEVQVTYVKNMNTNAGEDCIWIDKICVVPAKDAVEALDRNPDYPVHEETTLTVDTPSARAVLISDPTGMLEYLFGDFAAFIIGDEQVEFSAGLAADIDPEIAFFFSDYDASYHPLSGITPDEDGCYKGTFRVDSMDETGYPYTTLYLYSDPALDPVFTLMYFKDEENLEMLLALVSEDEESPAVWRYEDEVIAEELADETAEVNYVVRCVDQNGDAVSGVMIQVCDDAVCTMFTTDESGNAEFALAPSLWEMHVLVAPSGYTADTETVYTLSPFGEEIEIVLEKN